LVGPGPPVALRRQRHKWWQVDHHRPRTRCWPEGPGVPPLRPACRASFGPKARSSSPQAHLLVVYHLTGCGGVTARFPLTPKAQDRCVAWRRCGRRPQKLTALWLSAGWRCARPRSTRRGSTGRGGTLWTDWTPLRWGAMWQGANGGRGGGGLYG
jgi:hypothetical protein